jgi:hypothetical protein
MTAIEQVFEHLIARFSRDSRVAVAGDVLTQFAEVLERFGNFDAAQRVRRCGVELLEQARVAMRAEHLSTVHATLILESMR